MSHRARRPYQAMAARRLAVTTAAIAALLLMGGILVSGGKLLPVAAAAVVGVTGLTWLRINKLLGSKSPPIKPEGQTDGDHNSEMDAATEAAPLCPGPSGASEEPAHAGRALAGEDSPPGFVRPVQLPEPHGGAVTEAGAPTSGPAVEAVPPPAEPDGRFPVLRTPSRAADAPWLLPSDTATHGVVADQALLGELHIRAASVVGPGHRAQGSARQDAYRLAQDRHGRYLIVVVADGMSDSKHADVGANAAVTAMAAALREALDSVSRPAEIDPQEIFLAAAARMYRTAESRRWDPDDMRAVAVAAVVPVQAEASGTREVWMASMGDASAWRLHDGTWQRLIGDRKSVSALGLADGTVEHFLPFEVERFVCKHALLSAGDVLAVLTDGVADALEQVPEAGTWFAGRWRQPPPVGSFLLDVGFHQTQMQDDRTAIAVWCGEGERAR